MLLPILGTQNMFNIIKIALDFFSQGCIKRHPATMQNIILSCNA